MTIEALKNPNSGSEAPSVSPKSRNLDDCIAQFNAKKTEWSLHKKLVGKVAFSIQSGERLLVILKAEGAGQNQDSILLSPFNSESGSLADTTSEVESFLEYIYDVSSQGNSSKACVLVMEFLDRNLLLGDFSKCNQFLSLVNVERLLKHPKVFVSILGITLAAKRKLSRRKILFERIIAACTRELGEARAKGVFNRFE